MSYEEMAARPPAGGEKRAPSALAALAAGVERVERALPTVEQVARDALDKAEESRKTSDEANRVVLALVEDVRKLIEQIGEAPAVVARPVSWLTMKDPAEAAEALADLRDWLEGVFLHQAGAVEALGQCWALHPDAIEQLFALRAAWFEAYAGPHASGTRAAEWYERLLPGALKRLKERTMHGIAWHRSAREAVRVRPEVPLADDLDALADWWAKTHGTEPPPPVDAKVEAGVTGRASNR